MQNQIVQHWLKQNQKLLKLIQKKKPNKHRLRILIKQLRYNSKTYQVILPKHLKLKRLEKLQAPLGSWHGHSVCPESAQQAVNLDPLIPIWRLQLLYWYQKSDQALKKLKRKHFS